MACTKAPILSLAGLAQPSESSPTTTTTTGWPQMTPCQTNQKLPLLVGRPRTHLKQIKNHPNFLVARAICLNSKNWNRLKNKSSKAAIKKKYPTILCHSIRLLRENHAENIYQSRLNGVKDLQLKHLWKLLISFTSSIVWQMRKKWQKSFPKINSQKLGRKAKEVVDWGGATNLQLIANLAKSTCSATQLKSSKNSKLIITRVFKYNLSI